MFTYLRSHGLPTVRAHTMHDTSKVCGHSGEEDYVPARTGGAQPLSGRRLTSTETIRLIRDGKKGWMGYGGG